MKQFFKNKIISLAIGRAGNIVAMAVNAIAGFVVLDGFLSDGAQAAMWENVTAALTILVIGGLQYLGSKWAGEGIKPMQVAVGTKPDGIPGEDSKSKGIEKSLSDPMHGNPNRR